jgi:hypothetical protein
MPDGKRTIGTPSLVLAVELPSAVGLAGVVLYAAGQDQRLDALAIALLAAIASLVAGVLVGFLFGIPRTLSGSAGTSSGGYAANTNLEQISDWLTKILVGIGLTQLGTIRDGAAALFATVGTAMSPAPSTTGAVAAGSIVVYFSGFGFLVSWLSTRLFLAISLTEADQEAYRLIEKASVAAAKGDVTAANDYRTQAADLLQQTTHAYDQLRSTEPASAQRTATMDAMSAQLFEIARQHPLDEAAVRRRFSGTAGDRIGALINIEANPDPRMLDVVQSAITSSMSAHEQFRALAAALAVVPLLSTTQRGDVIKALDVGSAKYGSDTSRQDLDTRIRQAVAAANVAPPPTRTQPQGPDPASPNDGPGPKPEEAARG